MNRGAMLRCTFALAVALTLAACGSAEVASPGEGDFGGKLMTYRNLFLIMAIGGLWHGGDSWNYGAGANYYLDGVNGVRADWTRRDFDGDSNELDSYTLSYVRRF